MTGQTRQRKKALKKSVKAVQMLSKTIIYSFAVLGGLLILISCALVYLLGSSAQTAEIPEKAVLLVDFDVPYAETRSDDLLSALRGNSSASFTDLLRALHMAAVDDRIVALVGTVNQTSFGMAQIEELSNAVHNFRKAGKKTYMFSHGMGNFGQGNREYLLSTAFEKVILQPKSDIGLTGISVEVPFFKNALNKIGVKAEFYTRHEYKTASDSLLYDKMSAPYREEVNRLGRTLTETLQDTIVQNRTLPNRETLAKIMDNAPIFSEDALDLGLVDQLGYQQDLTTLLEEEYGKLPLVEMGDYLTVLTDQVFKGASNIAVLVLEGVIDSGKSSISLPDEAVIGADTVVGWLSALKEDPDLKAVVLRINSPGGSYTASDEIFNAINRFKAEKNVPVIVSMGDYAASGGYFVALAGDRVLADSYTLTGSIGVLGGKFVLADLWKKLGIVWEEVDFGANAGMLSMNRAFNAKEKSLFNRSLDRIYADFVSQVVQTRPIKQGQIDPLARGRVWLGAEAVERGLVDDIGGLPEALQTAFELGGLETGEPWNLVYYPQARSWMDRLADILLGDQIFSQAKVLEEFGMAPKDLSALTRLRFDAVLPPFRICY